MIAVIFEVWPRADKKDAYLNMAQRMRKELEQIDGFISVERFESITEAGKMLSVSFFRDESAVQQWRELQAHREAQQAGRGSYFADYRLRVCEVQRDYGLTDRAEAPADSKALHG